MRLVCLTAAFPSPLALTWPLTLWRTLLFCLTMPLLPPAMCTPRRTLALRYYLVSKWHNEKSFLFAFGSRTTSNLFLKLNAKHSIAAPQRDYLARTGREKAVELYVFLLKPCWYTKVGTRCSSMHIYSIFQTLYTVQPALRKNIFSLTFTLQRLIFFF